MKLMAAIAIAITIGAVVVYGQSAKGDSFEVTTLSARPEMVSGGDVLIRIAVPAPARTETRLRLGCAGMSALPGPHADFSSDSPTGRHAENSAASRPAFTRAASSVRRTSAPRIRNLKSSHSFVTCCSPVLNTG
jgi:hypothetical protein